jgi:hypothetical protein
MGPPAMRPLVFAIVSVVLCSACEKIDYIELAPTEVVLKQPNNQVYVEAKPFSRAGNRAKHATIDWSIGDAAIATVSGKGQVTPVADGDTEVIARIGDVEARVPVRVIYVDRIEVEPAELIVTEGTEAAKVVVKAFRKNGKQITDRSVVMKVADKAIAQVVGTGQILPLDPGTTTIDVQVDNAHTSLKVIVEAEKKEDKKTKK